MSQLSCRIDLDCTAPTQRSVAKDAHRRVVHKKAWSRLTPCSIDLPAINDANGRNRCRTDAAYFDSLGDERTGNENGLLNHFFLSLRVGLHRGIGKRGAGRDYNRKASGDYTFHNPKYTRSLALQIAPNTRRSGSFPRLLGMPRLSLELS